MGAVRRRRTTIRNTLLAGVAAIALMAAAPEATVAQERPGWFGNIEGRYLKSFGDDTDVSLFDFGQGGRATFGLDVYGPASTEVELDDGWGGRLALGYRSSGPWDFTAAGSGGWLDGDRESAYYYYATSTTDRVALGLTIDVEPEADYFVIDFEVGYNFQLGNPGFEGRVFAGVRYANFDQDVRGVATGFYYYYGFTTSDDIKASSTALVTRDVDYWGVGPRIGASGAMPLTVSNTGHRKLSLVGAVAGSALFGDRDTDDSVDGAYVYYTYDDTLRFDFFSDSASDDESKTVFNVEAELGLSYTIAGNANGGIEITAGYRAEYWWNVNNTNWLVLGPRDGVVSSRDGDFAVHGPFLRIGIRR